MNNQVSKQDILQQSPAPISSRSQSTSIEQSRAVAEVQSAVVIAQQNPRDKTRAIEEMRESCAIMALAERAFFRFPRGGQTVAGASVHLARDLARCWGNIDYGIKELDRDDDAGHSEMLAFAWDLQTNTRAETTFIVPHKRDAGKTTKELTAMRDIYENNANAGARRLREMIFAVVPPWFVEDAKQHCQDTLENGGGVPLAQRITKLVESFDALNVSREMLEKRVSKSVDKLTANDVAQLGVIYKSIQRNEVSVEDEFSSDDAVETTKALKKQAKEKKPDFPALSSDEPRLNAARTAAKNGELDKWLEDNAKSLEPDWVAHYEPLLRKLQTKSEDAA